MPLFQFGRLIEIAKKRKISLKQLYRINRILSESLLLRFEFTNGDFGDLNQWFEEITLYTIYNEKIAEYLDDSVLGEIGHIFYNENFVFFVKMEDEPYRYFIFNKSLLYDRYDIWSKLSKLYEKANPVDPEISSTLELLNAQFSEVVKEFETNFVLSNMELINIIVTEIKNFQKIESTPDATDFLESVYELPVINEIYKGDVEMLNYIKKDHPQFFLE